MDAQQFLQTSAPDGDAAQDERGLFHSTWYAERYLTARDVDSAWDHYCSVGESLGYQPHPFFIPAFYRATSGEYRSSPLRHFAEVGLRRGLSPHPLLRSFSSEKGLRWHEVNDDPTIAHLLTPVPGAAEGSSLLRYLLSPSKEWRYPNVAFDRSWYAENYSRDCEQFGDPLSHYLAVGGFEGRPTGPGLEWRSYIERDPSVLRGVVTPMEHYLLGHSGEGNYFGRVRPEVQIMDALRSSDISRSRALLAAHHKVEHGAWSIVKLRETPFRGSVSLRTLGGAILSYRAETGYLYGDAGPMNQAAHWVRSGDFVAIRSDQREEHGNLTRCLILGEHQIFDAAAVQAVFSQARSDDVPVATTPALEQAAKVLERHAGVRLKAFSPREEIGACVLSLEPGRVGPALIGRRTDIVVSAAANRTVPPAECSISAVGLAMLLSLLPAASSVSCTNAQNLSPMARRGLSSLAASRSIRLQLRTKDAD